MGSKRRMATAKEVCVHCCQHQLHQNWRVSSLEVEKIKIPKAFLELVSSGSSVSSVPSSVTPLGVEKGGGSGV